MHKGPTKLRQNCLRGIKGACLYNLYKTDKLKEGVSKAEKGAVLICEMVFAYSHFLPCQMEPKKYRFLQCKLTRKHKY